MSTTVTTSEFGVWVYSCIDFFQAPYPIISSYAYSPSLIRIFTFLSFSEDADEDEEVNEGGGEDEDEEEKEGED